MNQATTSAVCSLCDAQFVLTKEDKVTRTRVINQMLTKGLLRERVINAFGKPAVRQAEMRLV